MSDVLQPIDYVEGTGVPVRGNDIDTDRIIPARYMKVVSFDGIQEHVFKDARADAKRRGEEHPFDQVRYRSASVLVVNQNFGCGSSREHAPQALMRWGISAIVGESFAEIFFGNCVALGVPCVTLDQADVVELQGLIEAEPELPILVNVRAGKVMVGDGRREYDCHMPAGAKHQFESGTWDALAVLQEAGEQIQATYERLPYTSW